MVRPPFERPWWENVVPAAPARPPLAGDLGEEVDVLVDEDFLLRGHGGWVP